MQQQNARLSQHFAICFGLAVADSTRHVCWLQVCHLVHLDSAWRSAARACSCPQDIIRVRRPPWWLLTGVLVLHKTLQQGWLGSGGPLLSRAVGKAVGKAQAFVCD